VTDYIQNTTSHVGFLYRQSVYKRLVVCTTNLLFLFTNDIIAPLAYPRKLGRTRSSGAVSLNLIGNNEYTMGTKCQD
jgi:hypothetical protein